MSLTDLRRPLPLVAFAFPIAIVFENKLTPVFLIGLVAAAVLLARPLRPRLWPPLLAGFALLLLWALVSAVWSIEAMLSLERFGRLAVTVAGGLFLCAIAASRDADGQRAAGSAFVAGFLIAALLAILFRVLVPAMPDGPGMARFIWERPLLSFGAIAVVFFFPLAAMLERRPLMPLVPVALVAAVAVVALRGNSASLLALGIGVLACALVYLFGRRGVLAVAVALPLLFVSSAAIVRTADAPAILKERGLTLPNSIGHRLIVWRFVYGKAQERPVMGWGLHTSRRMPDRETEVGDDPDYADIMAVTRFFPEAKIEKIPMHPHNATLQLWLELGAVGLVLYAFLFGVCLWGMSRLGLSRIALASGTGGVVAVFVIGQVSFSAWQSWWLCTQFLAAAFFLFVVRKAPPASPAGAERHMG